MPPLHPRVDPLEKVGAGSSAIRRLPTECSLGDCFGQGVGSSFFFSFTATEGWITYSLSTAPSAAHLTIMEEAPPIEAEERTCSSSDGGGGASVQPPWPLARRRGVDEGLALEAPARSGRCR